ncbi:MAG: hypothetical protein QQN63_00170 [Nitrosopumilus sp.]
MTEKQQLENWVDYIRKAREFRTKIETMPKDGYAKSMILQERKKPENVTLLNALHVWESFLGTQRKLP